MNNYKYAIAFVASWFVISVALAVITSFITDVLFWADTVYRAHFWVIFFIGCGAWFYLVKKVAPWIIAYNIEVVEGRKKSVAIKKVRESHGTPLPESWLIWLAKRAPIPR